MGTLLTRIRERIRESRIHMSRLLTDHTMYEYGEATFREIMAPELSSTELEELRLDRLQELRAVIASLRRERGLAPSNSDLDSDFCLKNPPPKYLPRHS